jgi:tetrahydromethanopterin S-methyltransferase subunit G
MKKLVFTTTIIVDEPSEVEIDSFIDEIEESIDVTWGEDAQAVFITCEEEDADIG